VPVACSKEINHTRLLLFLLVSDSEVIEVHVDAKILNRDKKENHRTFIGYCYVDGSEPPRFDEVNEEDSNQTDAAELYAVRFAIRNLQSQKGRFRILCDNQSVVEQLNNHRLGESKRHRREILTETWNLLQKQRDFFEVVPFPANLAHKLLTEHVNAKLGEPSGSSFTTDSGTSTS
jgi:hypothetical protein